MSPLSALCLLLLLIAHQAVTAIADYRPQANRGSLQKTDMSTRVPQNFNLAQPEILNDDPLNVTWLMPSCGALTALKTNEIRRPKRTVGGLMSKKGQWPWMVAIHNFVDGNLCGGVLISDQHVLTAAHCVLFTPTEGLEITLRTNDLYAQDALYFNVSSIHVHELYEQKTIKNDIAILKLSEKVTFDQELSSICLPEIDDRTEDAMATVAGWGATYFGGPISSLLHHVSLPVWSQFKCKQIIDQKTRLTISDSQMCAGYLHAGKDACQGDSGGPLMLQSASGQWVVAGIVSAGRGCGDGGIPGIYTRVSFYSLWIRSVIES